MIYTNVLICALVMSVFSVIASSINMTISPSGPASEGSTVIITCRTGSANPAASVTWTRAGDDRYEELTEDEEPGEHNGVVTVSTVMVTVSEELQGQQYQCCLSESVCSQVYTLDFEFCKFTLNTYCLCSLRHRLHS